MEREQTGAPDIYLSSLESQAASYAICNMQYAQLTSKFLRDLSKRFKQIAI